MEFQANRPLVVHERGRLPAMLLSLGSFSCGFAALNFLMLPLGTRPASLCILALAYALSLFRGNRPTSPTSQKEVDPHKGQQPKNDRGPPGETRSSHYAPPGCCHAQ